MDKSVYNGSSLWSLSVNVPIISKISRFAHELTTLTLLCYLASHSLHSINLMKTFVPFTSNCCLWKAHFLVPHLYSTCFPLLQTWPGSWIPLAQSLWTGFTLTFRWTMNENNANNCHHSYLFFLFLTGSHNITQADFKLTIFLPKTFQVTGITDVLPRHTLPHF